MTKPGFGCMIIGGDKMDRRKFISKVMSYVEENYHSKLILKELAEISGYSVPQFSRLFTKFSGITPMRYVNVVRVQKAAHLLTTTEKSVTNICYVCGFDTFEVFERTFKKQFGLSASAYRMGDGFVEFPFYLSEQIYYERVRQDMTIDNGNVFDWGKIAEMYAKCRNIYPQDFWNTLHSLGVGNHRQKILDIGIGTGILPMNMSPFGGDYTGLDQSKEMIEQARTADPGTTYVCGDAHRTPFADGTFHVVTALQCWVYFDKEILVPEIHRVLKQGGHLYVMFMTWLPEEDEIIRKSFSIVKKYSPNWSAFMKRVDEVDFPWMDSRFEVETTICKDYRLPFTRDGWCDRMTASRGVGATLKKDAIAAVRADLMDMLCRETEKEFSLLHQAVIVKIRKT